MKEPFLAILLPLATAHVLVDFLIQSDDDVRRKTQPLVLVKHGLLVGVLSYLLLGLLTAWDLVLGVMASHLMIDYLKLRSAQGSNLSKFFLDQGAHFLILILFSWAAAGGRYQHATPLWGSLFGYGYYRILTLVAGGVLSVYVGSFIVEYTFEELEGGNQEGSPSIESEETPQGGRKKLGFAEGGKVIGYLERSLIFLFLLAEHPAGIGFLIAAKSIFRFGELMDTQRRRQAEYIIIGTLTSILIGTAVSYLTYIILAALR